MSDNEIIRVESKWRYICRTCSARYRNTIVVVAGYGEQSPSVAAVQQAIMEHCAKQQGLHELVPEVWHSVGERINEPVDRQTFTFSFTFDAAPHEMRAIVEALGETALKAVPEQDARRSLNVSRHASDETTVRIKTEGHTAKVWHDPQ